MAPKRGAKGGSGGSGHSGGGRDRRDRDFTPRPSAAPTFFDIFNKALSSPSSQSRSTGSRSTPSPLADRTPSPVAKVSPRTSREPSLEEEVSSSNAWDPYAPLAYSLSSKEECARSKAEGDALFPPDEELAKLFRKLITSYIEDNESFPLYKAKVIGLIERSFYVLEVDYEHILARGGKNLFLKIGNDNASAFSWLRNDVRSFFEEVCEEVNEKRSEKIILDPTNIGSARVIILNKPSEVLSYADLSSRKNSLVRRIILSKGQKVCRAASTFGRDIMLAIMSHVLSKHDKGFSWNGSFTSQDIYFFIYPNGTIHCRILSVAASNDQLHKRGELNPGQCTADEKAKDFAMVDSVMMPLFKEGDEFPLYFEALSGDLGSGDISWEGIKENFEYHPGIMPSSARRVLTADIHYVARAMKLSLDGRYKRLFDEKPDNLQDWRYMKSIQGDNVLSGVYWFENPGKDIIKDEHQDTFISAIDTSRHVHQHGYQHYASKSLDDHDESELHTALALPMVLPTVFKELLKNKLMSGKLESARQTYYASRGIRKEPANESLFSKD